MQLTSYDKIEPVPPEWLWSGRIPLGELTILAGDGGIGKGFLGADLVARVTRGDVMPDGSEGVPAGNVVMVTAEDDPNSAMSYRLRGARADLARVYDATEGFLIPGSVPALREMLSELGARLVWIDPISAVSEIRLTSSNVWVRRNLMLPLQQMAKDTGAAIVAVHHTVKSGRIAGTKGITDAARMVLKVERNANDSRVRLIHVEKCNIASDAIGDVAYTVAGLWPDTGVEYLDVPEDAIMADARRPSTRERIVELLRGRVEPYEGTDIAKALGLSYGSTRVALYRLANDEESEVFSPTRGMWTVRREGPTLTVVGND